MDNNVIFSAKHRLLNDNTNTLCDKNQMYDIYRQKINPM